MPQLWICDQVLPTHRPSFDAAWLRQIIWGLQGPQFIDEGRGPGVWQSIGLHNLTDRLERATGAHLLISPRGVFGAYQADLVKIAVHERRIFGTVVTSDALPRGQFELPHVQIQANLGGFTEYLRQRPQGSFFVAPQEKICLRAFDDTAEQLVDALAPTFPTERAILLGARIDVNQAGSRTRLLWEARSFAVQVLRGRQRVILFPAYHSEVFGTHRGNHVFARCAAFSEPLTPTILQEHPEFHGVRGFECLMDPDQWVYVPAGWMYQIETLVADTVTLFARFAC